MQARQGEGARLARWKRSLTECAARAGCGAEGDADTKGPGDGRQKGDSRPTPHGGALASLILPSSLLPLLRQRRSRLPDLCCARRMRRRRLQSTLMRRRRSLETSLRRWPLRRPLRRLRRLRGQSLLQTLRPQKQKRPLQRLRRRSKRASRPRKTPCHSLRRVRAVTARSSVVARLWLPRLGTTNLTPANTAPAVPPRRAASHRPRSRRQKQRLRSSLSGRLGSAQRSRTPWQSRLAPPSLAVLLPRAMEPARARARNTA